MLNSNRIVKGTRIRPSRDNCNVVEEIMAYDGARVMTKYTYRSGGREMTEYIPRDVRDLERFWEIVPEGE